MTYKEYESALNGIVQNPDTAPTAVQSLLQEIKTDTEALATAINGISERDARIRDLQDTNIKLFMSQSSAPENDPEPEPEMTFEELLKSKIVEEYGTLVVKRLLLSLLILQKQLRNCLQQKGTRS